VAVHFLENAQCVEWYIIVGGADWNFGEVSLVFVFLLFLLKVGGTGLA